MSYVRDFLLVLFRTYIRSDYYFDYFDYYAIKKARKIKGFAAVHRGSIPLRSILWHQKADAHLSKPTEMCVSFLLSFVLLNM